MQSQPTETAEVVGAAPGDDAEFNGSGPSRDDLSPAALEVLKREYPIGDWLECRRTPKGHANVSFYLTTTEGRYVLRRSNSRKTLEHLVFETSLIEYLRANSYPAPEIVQTRRGDAYVTHDGVFYLLTVLIEGTPYAAGNREQTAAAARSLGLYHALVEEWDGKDLGPSAPSENGSSAEMARVFDETAAVMRPFLSIDERERLSAECFYLAADHQKVEQALANRDPGQRLVIHGSFGRSPLIFTDDRVVGVVDFDRAALDLRGLDLAYTVKAFCRTYDEAADDYRVGIAFGEVARLLAEYRSQVALPNDEVSALPLIFRQQRLAKVDKKCRNFLNKNAVIPQKAKDVRKVTTMISREVTRVKWLEENNDALVAAMAE